jgi:hypothetical protein
MAEALRLSIVIDADGKPAIEEYRKLKAANEDIVRSTDRLGRSQTQAANRTHQLNRRVSTLSRTFVGLGSAMADSAWLV